MWNSNSQKKESFNCKPMNFEQPRNTNNEHCPSYQTPIKQSLNIHNNNNSPLRVDFNFYFGNLWSSGHLPGQNSDIINNNNSSISKLNKESNILLFKSSIEKSGYRLTPNSEMKNNIINYDLNHLSNIYENDLDQNEFTKKNLNELFNNAKDDEFLQKNKLDNNIIDKNIINFNENNNCFLVPNKRPRINFSTKVINNNIVNNYKSHIDDKENIDINTKNNNNFFIENKIVDNIFNGKSQRIPQNSILNEENNNKENEIFDSPVIKNPKKIFECSGSTLATNSSKSSTRKRRLRKNNKQLAMLLQFYHENKNWTKSQIKAISEKIGLKENKVYKWLWDQKNKEYRSTKFVINKKKLP